MCCRIQGQSMVACAKEAAFENEKHLDSALEIGIAEIG
jgi:hypothetical protein